MIKLNKKDIMRIQIYRVPLGGSSLSQEYYYEAKTIDILKNESMDYSIPDNYYKYYIIKAPPDAQYIYVTKDLSLATEFPSKKDKHEEERISVLMREADHRFLQWVEDELTQNVAIADEVSYLDHLGQNLELDNKQLDLSKELDINEEFYIDITTDDQGKYSINLNKDSIGMHAYINGKSFEHSPVSGYSTNYSFSTPTGNGYFIVKNGVITNYLINRVNKGPMI